MSDSTKKIIKFFCDRFLEIENYPIKLSEILKLSINCLKGFDDKIVKELESLKISTIGDLAQLNSKGFKKLQKKHGITPQILQNALIGANMISNAWNKRASYTKKVQNKVVITGLDFAGKTSLINRLKDNYNYTDMINLEPTIGVNIEEYKTKRLNLVIWDLGGQKMHIDEYLQEPEKFFVQLDVLIFVIDTQDDARYDQVIKYLNDIIDILDYLKEFPLIMILLNKADSDIIEDPDFQIQLEYISEKISDVISNKKNNWRFEIITISLYNYISNEPEIVKNIKDIFSLSRSSENDKIVANKTNNVSAEIDEKFQKILDINLKLMDKVSSELTTIKKIISRSSPLGITNSQLSAPFISSGSEYISSPKKQQQKRKGKKGQLIGPPIRLAKVSTPSNKSISIENSTSNIKSQINNARPNLNLTPPRAPIPASPPKNVPKPGNLQVNRALLRDNIISELKYIFDKKGIAQ